MVVQRKSERIELRATPRQAEAFQRAADVLEKSRTDFMLDVAFEESQRVLADRRVFVLDDERRDEFVELLDRPARVVPEIRALFERGSVLGHDERTTESLAT